MSTVNLERLRALFGSELPQEALAIMRTSKTVAGMWDDLEQLANRINAPTRLHGYLVTVEKDGETARAFVSAALGNVKLAAETWGDTHQCMPLYVRAGDHTRSMREVIEGWGNGPTA
jgi:hypothetical protein